MRIDAHHHLWQYNPEEYDWIDDSMVVLKKNFLIEELQQTLANNHIDGSIAVQARQSIEETNWLLSLANSSAEIKGVVGWIDLKSETLNHQLKQCKSHKKLVGFRHVIQGETDPDFMRNDKFIHGLKALAEHGYCYDLLIYAHQLPSAIEMLAKVPDLRVVIDHIAKPNIKTGDEFSRWQYGMKTLAKNPNVYCKVSGMVTEADWQNWQYENFVPYLDTIFQYFGENRVMFGSDWPVCLVAGDYSKVKQIIHDYLSNKNQQTIGNVFGLNAAKFYQLD
ncbi:amidohydrolase family protein [Thalassotalea sp. SU-HH00458]|uniref:amidohydrolase family protein n=1 Tax=Thalassotalea sp. SU-HH00458 TaxID=3127657 RepID=UPI003104D80C